jgi:leucyl-tRNA synthetase
MKRYNPNEIETKWQKSWEDNQVNKIDDNDPRPKFYSLVEFPYPSGVGLHVGHCRPYITFDVMSRWRRMGGENVIFPMGWDAFGLPAEQYALKTGVHPSIVTQENINNFRNQAKQLGLSFDWSREFSTTDPDFYKWTQWIFLNLFREGLAYQAESVVWWCEGLKSVLADEEVIDGRSERGDFPCERRPLRQWMLAITKYAGRLYDDLEDVDYYEPVKVQQRNWIGPSKGAEVKFKIADSNETLTVFTTRVDTLYGVTYMVLAPEHPLVSSITSKEQDSEVKKYVTSTASKSDLTRQEDAKDKTGIFTGAYAINPLNNEKIPIWISDYVLMNYGTGAIMAVPAHDQRDFEFATKFNLPIINVVNPQSIRSDSKKASEFIKNDKIVAVVVNDKSEVLTVNWGKKLGGRLLIGGTVEKGESPTDTAIREVREETGYNDLEVVNVGEETYNYKYFAFSKQKHYEASTKFVYLKLKSDSRVDQKLDKSEENNFSVEWVSFATAEKDIVEPLHKYGFDKFILGKCFGGEGTMTNSGKYDGLSSSTAREKIVADLDASNLAVEVTNYKLRDWVFSRQRYWGEPFPIVWVSETDYKKANGDVAKWLPKIAVTKPDGDKTLYAVPIPDTKLPVVLPEVDDFKPQGLGKGPLALNTEWCNVWFNSASGETVSQKDKKPEGDVWVEASRETDTMPNWAGSSWYYLRYADPHNDKELASKEKLNMWLPVNWYNGGMEHTTLHLLYSRFWHKFLFDIGVVNGSEPYKKRTSHGLILSEDGTKMSKSVGNVVDPLEVVESYGSDTLRLYICFIGPFEQAVSWNMAGVAGCRRFIDRLWVLAQDFMTETSDVKLTDSIKNEQLARVIAETNKKVSEDIPKLGFNTAVASLMTAVNELYRIRKELPYSEAPEDWLMTFNQLVLIATPFIPHVSMELWEQFKFEDSPLTTTWPMWDEKALINSEVTIAIQVNGKLRGEVTVPIESAESVIVDAAKNDAKVKPHLEGKKVIKTIYIQNKLVNFVVSN